MGGGSWWAVRVFRRSSLLLSSLIRSLLDIAVRKRKSERFSHGNVLYNTGTGSLWCCTRHSGAAEKHVRTKEKASRPVFWCAVRVTDGFEVRVGLCFVCSVDGQFDG